MLVLALLFAGIAFLVASVVDLRIREVPDWISYATLVAAVVMTLFTIIGDSAFSPFGFLSLLLLLLHIFLVPFKKNDFFTYAPVVFAGLCALGGWSLGDASAAILVGVGAFLGFLIGAFMYVLHQWGGGDAKLLVSTGALFGLSGSLFLFANFLLYLILAGALWGLGFASYLAIRDRKQFLPAMNALYRKARKTRYLLLILLFSAVVMALLFVQDLFLRLLVLLFGGVPFLLFLSILFSRALERTSMRVRYPLNRLMEGDYVLEHFKAGRRVIPKKEYITEEEIKLLRTQKIRSVLVKEGVPFVPSFLLAYLFVLVVFLQNRIDLLALLVR